MLLGEMRADLRRTVTMQDQIDRRIDRIDEKLADGSHRFDRIEHGQAEMIERMDEIEAAKKEQPAAPQWEATVKWILTYIAVPAALLATGNAQLAFEAFKQVLTRGQ